VAYLIFGLLGFSCVYVFLSLRMEFFLTLVMCILWYWLLCRMLLIVFISACFALILYWVCFCIIYWYLMLDSVYVGGMGHGEL
jgi:hypothetical protein